MKEEIQIIIDYVEGRITVDEFKHSFENNEELQKLLDIKLPFKCEHVKSHGYSLYHYFKYGDDFPKGSWNNISVRYIVFANLIIWLYYNDIMYDATNKYKEDSSLLLDIQPPWLDCIDDQGIFDKIIAELPKNICKTKQISLGKARIKELFRYDKTYPRWIQSPEWPIVNGKPLIFSHQRKAGKDDERTFYYFYDPDTKEETVITQFY